MTWPMEPEGAVCPVPRGVIRPGQVLHDRFRATGLGREKRCCACGEFWPMDTEFWFLCAKNFDGLDGRCKACRREGRRSRSIHMGFLPECTQ